MGNEIHSTAIIGKNVELGNGVTIKPYAIIEDDVVLEDNVSIGAGTLIGSDTTIGAGTTIYNNASIGTIAQDLKYKGEKTTLVIGKNNIIREFCSINRGTAAKGTTIIGDNCALLSYSHVAHDCVIGNNVIASNCLSMAGHVEVGDYAVIGGNTTIHQFCKIGSYSMIGATSFLSRDVVPFGLCARGKNATERIAGINAIGLERRGFDEERRRIIKNAFKILFRKKLSLKDAVDQMRKEYPDNNDISLLLNFIESSERGFYNMDK